jgi:GNAT superfamily N-acetyltransferase
MDIKVLENENIDKIIPLLLLWCGDLGYTVPTKDNIRSYMIQTMKNTIYIYLSNNENVVGIVGYTIETIPWTNIKEAHEHFFYIHPDYRNQGYGKLLRQAFETCAKANNCSYAVMLPSKQGSVNPKHAKKYFEKRGYELYGYALRKEIN